MMSEAEFKATVTAMKAAEREMNAARAALATDPAESAADAWRAAYHRFRRTVETHLAARNAFLAPLIAAA